MSTGVCQLCIKRSGARRPQGCSFLLFFRFALTHEPHNKNDEADISVNVPVLHSSIYWSHIRSTCGGLPTFEERTRQYLCQPR